MHRAVDVFDQRVDDALGMDHDLDLLGRALNSQRASITSRPLFIIVAESTEILRPITQFGMRARLIGRHVRRARAAAASGTARRTRSAGCGARRRRRARRAIVARQRLEDRVVLAVDRQQRRAARAHRVHEDRAGGHQRLLVGEQDFLPARAAASVGRSPAMPTIAAITVSTSAALATCSSASRAAAHFARQAARLSRARSSSGAAPRLPASPRCAGGTRGTARSSVAAWCARGQRDDLEPVRDGAPPRRACWRRRCRSSRVW